MSDQYLSILYLINRSIQLASSSSSRFSVPGFSSAVWSPWSAPEKILLISSSSLLWFFFFLSPREEILLIFSSCLLFFTLASSRYFSFFLNFLFSDVDKCLLILVIQMGSWQTTPFLSLTVQYSRCSLTCLIRCLFLLLKNNTKQIYVGWLSYLAVKLWNL